MLTSSQPVAFHDKPVQRQPTKSTRSTTLITSSLTRFAISDSADKHMILQENIY
jgi:hypothetical protein